MSMYKTLCAAVLLVGTFALTGRNSAATQATSFASPQIVAKGRLLNERGAIPTTTIFTPPQTGLYRFSAYSTGPLSSASGYWNINLYWTDDFGPEWTTELLQNANGGFGSVGWPSGTVGMFEVIAGQPVSYSITLATGDGGGSYSLYYTIERLE